MPNWKIWLWLPWLLLACADSTPDAADDIVRVLTAHAKTDEVVGNPGPPSTFDAEAIRNATAALLPASVTPTFSIEPARDCVTLETSRSSFSSSRMLWLLDMVP